MTFSDRLRTRAIAEQCMEKAATIIQRAYTDTDLAAYHFYRIAQQAFEKVAKTRSFLNKSKKV